MAAKKQGAVKKQSGGAKKLTTHAGGKGRQMSEDGRPILRDGKTPLNLASATSALQQYGVEVPAGISPLDLDALLRKTLEGRLSKLKEMDKIKCTNVCGEIATNDTDFCPFCGDEGGEEDAAGAAEVGEDPGAEEPEAVPAPLAAPSSTEAGLAAAGAKLDEKLRRINELKSNIAGNSYDLGVELREIHEGELWKAKGYEDFKTFIEKELEIGRAMAYRLMDITKEFSRETFESVGSHKLALIAGIEDADARSAALELAKAGATTKDVERHVSAAKGKTAAATPPKKTGGSDAPPKKGANDITLLTKVGSKAQLVQWRSSQSNRPLTMHKDDAYAEIPLSAEVKQRIALKFDKDGNIVGLTYAFVRVG